MDVVIHVYVSTVNIYMFVYFCFVILIFLYDLVKDIKNDICNLQMETTIKMNAIKAEADTLEHSIAMQYEMINKRIDFFFTHKIED